MKLVNVIVVLLYIVLSAVTGLVLMNIIDYSQTFDWLEVSYNLLGLELSISWVVGILLLCINLCVLAKYLLFVFRKRRIIFNRPEGDVSISLSAIEDFIKRSTSDIRGVKELKPWVRVARKNLTVSCRVVLSSEANVLETTNKVQVEIKDRIQELVGSDNVSDVSVHVSRIVKKSQKEIDKEKKENPPVPYQGLDYGDGN